MIWAAVAVLLGAGAVLPVWLRHPRRSEAPRARARAAHTRLLHAVETGEVDADALARAQERLTTCGALIAAARTARGFRDARRVAEEGLALLGDPGQA